MWISALICLLTLTSLSEAHGSSGVFSFYGADSYQTYGCVAYLSSVATFCKTSSSSSGHTHSKRGHGGASSSCYCSNENALASVIGCMNDIGKKTTGGLEYYIKYCEKLSVSLTMNKLEEAFEYYESNATYTQDIENFSSSSVVDVPIKSNVTLAKTYYLAEYIHLGNFDRSIYYGSGALAYWGLVFLVATVANWAPIVFPSLRITFNGSISKIWRKYVTLPALVRRKRNQEQIFLKLFSFIVPSRLESLVVFGFFWMMFAFSVAHVQIVKGEPIYSSEIIGLLRVIADRTGILGTVLMPLLFLLAGRNNFLQWLTRWKYSTFITFHRWIARVDVALIFVHAVSFTAYFIDMGMYATRIKRLYVEYGILATVCGSLMCFQGLLYLRRKAYEIFLVIHIILAVGWAVGSWKHLADLGYMPYVYAMVAVWAFDRFVRLVRIALFGFPKAQISLFEDEVLRVVVPRPKFWKPVPGGHVWLHICYGWDFWQSHPFTFLESCSDRNEIVFLCKVKNGLTRRIAKKLASTPGRAIECRVAVEGPYGQPCPVSKHSSAVFLAGGNGIPGIFSEIFALDRRSCEHSKQKLRLYWVIREMRSVAWMLEELKALRSTKIETIIYVTKPELEASQDFLRQLADSSETSSLEEQESEAKKTEDEGNLATTSYFEKLSELLPHIEIRSGRPSISEMVQHEIEESNHSVAFVSCGHPIMVDELRASVIEKLDTTEKRVDFFEQLQVWA